MKVGREEPKATFVLYRKARGLEQMWPEFKSIKYIVTLYIKNNFFTVYKRKMWQVASEPSTGQCQLTPGKRSRLSIRWCVKWDCYSKWAKQSRCRREDQIPSSGSLLCFWTHDTDLKCQIDTAGSLASGLPALLAILIALIYCNNLWQFSII